MSITIFSQDKQKKQDSNLEETTEHASENISNNTFLEEKTLDDFNSDTNISTERTDDSLPPAEIIKETLNLENELKETSEAEIRNNINKANSLSHTIKQERSTRKNLVSFAPKPIRAKFDSQMKDETIILMLRQHPITQLGKVLIIIIGIFFPIFLLTTHILEFLQLNYKIAAIIGWFLLLSGFTLETFLNWYFHVFFITDRRVIDVDFESMIYKDVSTAKLENIQDVSFITTGTLASLVDYGTVFLQTAGSQARIEFETVPHPAKVVKIINELIAQTRRGTYQKRRMG